MALSSDPDQARTKLQDAKQQEYAEQRVVYHLPFPLSDRRNGEMLPGFQTMELSAGERYTTERCRSQQKGGEDPVGE